MLMKSHRNGFGNERCFMNHTMRSLYCWIFLLNKGQQSRFWANHGWSTIGAHPNKLTPTQFVLKKKSINTWKASAALEVVCKGWQKRNSLLILSFATYLLYTSSFERLETTVVSFSWRAKTGEESIFDITLPLILSDISCILDFIVSLDSEICFIVSDAFLQALTSHFPICKVSEGFHQSYVLF